MGVYFKKVPTSGGDYTMDHTAAVFLMTRGGGLKAPSISTTGPPG